MLHPHAWYSDKGIKFIADDPAIKIDRTRKVVHTEKGEMLIMIV
jgi:NAD(P)H-nitrite reductase large subunit